MRRLLLLLWAGACVAPAPAYAAPLEDALFPRDFLGDAAKFTNHCGVWDGMSMYPVCRHGGSASCTVGGLFCQASAFWPLGDPLTSTTLADSTGHGNALTPYLRPATTTLAYRMGANLDNTQQLFGALSKWGQWHRLLTSAEQTALAAGQAWPFTLTPSLSDASAFWLLNETSGSTSYADATGRGNTLTATTGNLAQVAGPLAVDFGTRFSLDGGAAWIGMPSTADIQTGNSAWTIGGWVNLTSKPVGGLLQQIFRGQWDQLGQGGGLYASGTNIYYEPNGDTFATDEGMNNTSLSEIGTNPVVDNVGLSPTAGVWYYVLDWYDPVANTAYQSINNGTAASLGPIQQPTPVAGHIGNASNFIVNPELIFGTQSGWDAPPPSNGSSRAYMPTNSSVSYHGASFTTWGWVKSSNVTPTQTIEGIFYPASSGTSEWIVQISSGALYFVLANGGAIGTASSQSYGSVPLNDTNWHLFVCWYDSAQGKGFINLDHGAQSTNFVSVAPGAVTGSNVTFSIGAASRVFGDQNISHAGQQFLGSLNALGIAPGTPSAGDLAALWNSGAGVTR